MTKWQFLVDRSGLLDRLAHFAYRPRTDENTSVEDRYFQIFGDPAYQNEPHIMSPFSGVGERSDAEKEWNAEMSAV